MSHRSPSHNVTRVVSLYKLLEKPGGSTVGDGRPKLGNRWVSKSVSKCAATLKLPSEVGRFVLLLRRPFGASRRGPIEMCVQKL